MVSDRGARGHLALCWSGYRSCGSSGHGGGSRRQGVSNTGTQDSLMEASQFVQTLEKRQGMKISCIEEIAFRMGYINKDQLEFLGRRMVNSPYGEYLLKIIDE